MVEKFIKSFTSEIKEPNPFLFSLILANKFQGVIFVKDNEDDSMVDFVVFIDDKLYDMFGEVKFKDIDIENYVAFDKLSAIFSAKQYHSLKWLFINEINDDELYYNDIN
jgi:hypothetical protein